MVIGAAGGAATASATLTGAGNVTAAVGATGGAGGSGAGGAGASGAATATATAITSLRGDGVAGAPVAGIVALAHAMATGATGSFLARAETTLVTGGLVEQVLATATGAVDGVSVGNAGVAIGTAGPAFIHTNEVGAGAVGAGAVAMETGAPLAAGTAPVLANNAKIKAAFGAGPVFFATGELGAGHFNGGTKTETTTSEIDETVNLTKLASRQDLVVGFYNGTITGTGVTRAALDFYVDGKDVLHEAFASAAAARTWFTDHAVDLGSLASGSALVGSNNTLTLRAVVTVTSTSAGSGFHGDMIIGDPPAAANTVGTHQRFIEAAAGFGPVGAGSMALGSHARTEAANLLAVMRHAPIA